MTLCQESCTEHLLIQKKDCFKIQKVTKLFAPSVSHVRKGKVQAI